jgi:hypothetical protein
VVTKQFFTLLDLPRLVHHQVVQHVDGEVKMGVVLIKFIIISGAGTTVAIIGGGQGGGATLTPVGVAANGNGKR